MDIKQANDTESIILMSPVDSELIQLIHKRLKKWLRISWVESELNQLTPSWLSWLQAGLVDSDFIRLDSILNHFWVNWFFYESAKSILSRLFRMVECHWLDKKVKLCIIN